MSDFDALMLAICRNPLEDTLRLAFADLLDETGGRVNVARAEFIRLQVEWAAGSCPPEKLADSMKRQTELFTGFARSIVAAGFKEFDGAETAVGVKVAEMIGDFRDRICVVRRGFVAGVRMRCDDFMERAKEMFGRHPIEEVKLEDITVFDSGGNDTCYVGGLGRFPQKYWGRLENHKTNKDALSALSAVCVEHGREVSGITVTEGAT